MVDFNKQIKQAEKENTETRKRILKNSKTKRKTTHIRIEIKRYYLIKQVAKEQKIKPTKLLDNIVDGSALLHFIDDQK